MNAVLQHLSHIGIGSFCAGLLLANILTYLAMGASLATSRIDHFNVPWSHIFLHSVLILGIVWGFSQ